jgi:hypothetical protein
VANDAVPLIVVLSPRHAAAAGAILARSDADYPSFRHLFPDDERPRGLRALFTGIARDAARLGSACGAPPPDGELHGVALWLAPGKYPWSALRQLRGTAGCCRSGAPIPGHFRRSCRSGLTAPAFIPPIGTGTWRHGRRPRCPAQGLGGRLLKPALEIADRDRVDCYLETAEPRNAEYYARHGFVVENAAAQLAPDGLAHIAMRRLPLAVPG